MIRRAQEKARELGGDAIVLESGTKNFTVNELKITVLRYGD